MQCVFGRASVAEFACGLTVWGLWYGVTTPEHDLVVSFPDPAPLRGKQGLGTLVDFLGILCVSNHVTHA